MDIWFGASVTAASYRKRLSSPMRNTDRIFAKQSRLLIFLIVLFSCFSCKAETVAQETAIAQYGDVVRELQKSSQVLVEKAIDKPAACGGFLVQSEGAHLEGARLKVFVSFSMSETDLKALYSAVAKVGGQLLLRGLYQNSFQKTASKLRDLKIAVDIDPEAFEHYHVVAVPQFVLQSVDTSVFDTLKGNISLEFALEKFATNEGLKNPVKQLLKILRGTR